MLEWSLLNKWLYELREENINMEAAQIEIKVERGRLVVRAIGRGPRGQKYVKARKVLAARTMYDKDFKAQMDSAVKELLGSTA